jgi:hypothetical protein
MPGWASAAIGAIADHATGVVDGSDPNTSALRWQ